MAYTIVSPRFSFIRFGESDEVLSCSHPGGSICLPVYAEDDLAFQFIVRATTVEEADELCTQSGSGAILGITRDRENIDYNFLQQPERYRLNDYEVLFNWAYGTPDFDDVVDIGECFYISLTVMEQTVYSNCLKRIHDDCYTSVVEYGNDENVFGFNYCGGAPVGGDDAEACDPVFLTFTNETVKNIPYNSSMQARFGAMPTVKVWIYNEDNELQDMGIQVTFDTYPVTQINIDFGGPASGVIKIS